MDYSPPGSSVQGILKARILEWGAISFFRGSSWPRNQTHLSVSPALAGGSFTTNATWEAPQNLQLRFKKYLFSHDIIPFLKISFIYLLFFGYAGSSLLCVGYSLAMMHRLIAVASRRRAWVLGMQAPIVVAHGLQSLGSAVWHKGLVALHHVEIFWTRDWTCVLCIGSWILNH